MSQRRCFAFEAARRAPPNAAAVRLTVEELVIDGDAGNVRMDLPNLVDEAALTAARRKHERVTLADFTDTLEPASR